MNISRKEFLTGWLAPFGKLLNGAARTLTPETSEVEEVRVHGALLRIDQGRCLAVRGGCFSCLEQCPQEAISLNAGRGLQIDLARCSGCGLCVEVCPLTPTALQCVPDETKNARQA